MTLAPFMVKQVPGHDDLFAFQYDFHLSGKALDAPIVTEEENGDLIIEGWAAVFEGIDREGENFAPGAFKRGIKSFLERQASLCFHHKTDHGVGKVLELDEVEGKGLWMKARVDHQPETSPLRYIYNAVKKGTYNGLSVGGFFHRLGSKIADMDFTEISITPVPIHPGTKFSVVAGKALDSAEEKPVEIDLSGLEAILDRYDRLFTSLRMN
jgi:HK97 family phage prohead protease